MVKHEYLSMNTCLDNITVESFKGRIVSKCRRREIINSK